MVAARGDCTKAVPLEEVAGKKKIVPPDHAWIRTARDIGVSFGD
jgi:6-phosphofructokinase 1